MIITITSYTTNTTIISIELLLQFCYCYFHYNIACRQEVTLHLIVVQGVEVVHAPVKY